METLDFKLKVRKIELETINEQLMEAYIKIEETPENLIHLIGMQIGHNNLNKIFEEMKKEMEE